MRKCSILIHIKLIKESTPVSFCHETNDFFYKFIRKIRHFWLFSCFWFNDAVAVVFIAQSGTLVLGHKVSSDFLTQHFSTGNSLWLAELYIKYNFFWYFSVTYWSKFLFRWFKVVHDKEVSFICDIDVDDGYWRRNVLAMTSICWWRSWSFRSSISTIFWHWRRAPTFKRRHQYRNSVVNMHKSSPTLKHQFFNVHENFLHFHTV